MKPLFLLVSLLGLTGWGLLLKVLYHYSRMNAAKPIPSRPEPVVLSAEERDLASIHEAGHAIVAHLLGKPPVSISLEPGDAGVAATCFSSTGRHFETRESIRADIAILLAGRMAEEELRAMTSSGCIHDLRNASLLARRAVIVLSMGRRSGIIGVDDTPDQLSLLSEKSRREIEEDIREELDAGAQTAQKFLRSHRAETEHLAARLREEGSLSGPLLSSVFQEIH